MSPGVAVASQGYRAVSACTDFERPCALDVLCLPDACAGDQSDVTLASKNSPSDHPKVVSTGPPDVQELKHDDSSDDEESFAKQQL